MIAYQRYMQGDTAAIESMINAISNAGFMTQDQATKISNA